MEENANRYSLPPPPLGQGQELVRMQEVATKATRLLQYRLFPSTRDWLSHQLSPEKVEQIPGIYSSLLDSVETEARLYLGDKSLWWRLRQIIDDECRTNCLSYLSEIKNPVAQFNSAILENFETFHYFREPDLRRIVTMEFERIVPTPRVGHGALILETDSQISSLVKLGCDNLVKSYLAQNNAINQFERRLAEELLPEIVNLYNEEMGRFLTEKVFTRQQLDYMHDELVGELTQLVNSGFQFEESGGAASGTSDVVKMLVNWVECCTIDLFQGHLCQNGEKIRERSNVMTDLIQKWIWHYEEKVKELQMQSPNISKVELCLEHEKVVMETKSSFQTQIEEEFGRHEPLEIHLRSVWTGMDQFWNKKLPEDGRLKRYAQSPDYWKASFGFAGNPQKHFQAPLVFQFCSRRVRMGMCVNSEEPQMLKNPWGVDETPFVVGLDRNNQLIYGPEVTKLLPSFNGSGKKSKELKKFWWIADMILNGNPKAGKIRLNSELYPVNVELLLGLFLKRLKDHVEKELEGTCDTVVMTVPVWFSSSQRIQVKHGAKVAGFTEVVLVNESSAAAYSCPLIEGVPDNNIIVLSENCGNVDVTFYSRSVSATSQTLSMITHSGSFGVEKNYNGNWFQGNSKEKLKTKMKQVTENLLDEASAAALDPKYGHLRHDSSPIQILAVAESEKWKQVLETVGRKVADTECNLISNQFPVVFGAARLARNVEEIGKRVRDRLIFPSQISLRGEGGPFHLFGEGEVQLPEKLWKSETILPKHVQGVKIFQMINGSKHHVGQLKVLERYGKQVEVQMTVNNEAVVSFNDLRLFNQSGFSEYAKEMDYLWKCPNLTDGEVFEMKSIVNSFNET